MTIKDLRCKTRLGEKLGGESRLSDRIPGDYILFDLGTASDLEPITGLGEGFRVTMYDPDLLQRTHCPGKHQYLVAREAIEADVVISVPKLKTHKKSAITGALKNIVGINGLKDYLPHHRKGGSLDGGDCYVGRSRLKATIEDFLDAANRAGHPSLRHLFASGARLGLLAGRVMRLDGNLEGSWYGNDTVWRTCLDLQRILHYGRMDGVLSGRRQRRVLTITDAIIAGEDDGPLAPSPVPFGLVTMGMNTAALEWTHALLMGFDPRRIPLTREAFTTHPYPLADFDPERIEVEINGQRGGPDAMAALFGLPFRAAPGWRGSCELAEVRGTG